MEFFKDFLDEVGRRFKSPFVASFGIAWAITNWRIVLSVFIDNHHIMVLGYNNLFSFIESQITIQKALLIPLGTAIGYILAAPQIKRVIRIYINKVRVKENNQIIEDSNSAKVLLSEYNEKVKLLEEKERELDEYIGKHKDVKKELEKKELEVKNISRDRDEKIQQVAVLDTKAKDKDTLQERLKIVEARLRTINDSMILNGNWAVIVGSRFESDPLSISIDNQIISEWNGETVEIIGHIYAFHYTNKESELTFIKVLFKDKKVRLFQNNLKVELTKSSIQLSGTEIELPWDTESYPILYTAEKSDI
ncbi:hypothetical protein RT717_11585 [Imperialibacter roseus]|uniref:Uncharacterized protein n=1 Tax=Imperialibacter roseus TaxID=1324217 RepID=A0ABZ0IZA6_9BACT|nr:hypothetical protein [Imperialibacter roseus]WOK09280.1 hypothetical protein RT717_11585 [Imperialibacter roseus]